jgi:hypothetical protein
LSEPAFDASFGRLTSGPSGGIVALWRERHGDDWRLYAVASDASTDAWGSASQLSGLGADALDAQAAVASDGTSLVIWDSSDGSHQVIKAASRSPGQAWNEAQNVSVPDADSYHPQVAMGRDGTAVAVWSRSDGTRNVIQAAVRSAAAWGEAADLSDAANVTRSPQIAVGGDGTAVAAWERSDGDYSIIQASVLAPGGVWSAPQRLSVLGGSANSVRVAMDDAGDALAIWRWYDGGNWIIVSSFRPHGGNWARARQVSVPGISAGIPALAMNASGRATAIWVEASGIWSLNFENNRWSSERAVDDTHAGATSPSVAIDTEGNETAVWSVSGSVFGSFRASGSSGWDDGQGVNCHESQADTCFFTYKPKAVLTAPGKAVGLWLESRDEHQVVASAAYDNTTEAATSDDSSVDSSGDGLSGVSLTGTGGAETGVVIERASRLLYGKRIRLTVHCPSLRPCRGHLLLRRAGGVRALAGRSVHILAGRSTVLLLRVTGLPRSVLLKGARLTAQISIERVRRDRRPTVSGHSLVIIGRLVAKAAGVKAGMR